MSDYATPNLPSNDLDRTSHFYERLGFTTGFKDDGWMIMTRGGIDRRTNATRPVANSTVPW